MLGLLALDSFTSEEIETAAANTPDFVAAALVQLSASRDLGVLYQLERPELASFLLYDLYLQEPNALLFLVSDPVHDDLERVYQLPATEYATMEQMHFERLQLAAMYREIDSDRLRDALVTAYCRLAEMAA